MAKIVLDDDFLILLSKPWQKFFKKFKEIDSIPNSEWKPVHQLAYFSSRYNDFFGQSFSFSIKGAPSKCAEIYMLKRIQAMLGTSNQKALREYIDWIFDTKIIPHNRKIRSLGFMANTNFCNEFKLYQVKKSKICRSTSLPANYKEIAEKFDVPANTYGDLAFAKSALDSNPDNDAVLSYKTLFHELYKIGFEFEMIKNL